MPRLPPLDEYERVLAERQRKRVEANKELANKITRIDEHVRKLNAAKLEKQVDEIQVILEELVLAAGRLNLSTENITTEPKQAQYVTMFVTKRDDKGDISEVKARFDDEPPDMREVGEVVRT